ncbi:MAG: hypothetical protein HeimC3_31390 [Candidatus Heimdallarchaeota archaeon LC_3]|nr:MAG: hypothetical protein HeimC3_31390 [Candidatus Heimdallarchaeota archaeon LC_3]
MILGIMPSSITVNDKLRRKIKKIAAELDTTQGEVVAKAIDQFEINFFVKNYIPIPEARKLIRDSYLKRKNIKWRKTIRNALSKPGPTIDEMRISSWGIIDENQS